MRRMLLQCYVYVKKLLSGAFSIKKTLVSFTRICYLPYITLN
jgi:hypothetical protein